MLEFRVAGLVDDGRPGLAAEAAASAGADLEGVKGWAIHTD